MLATYATHYVLKNEIDHFKVLAEWTIDEKEMINFVLIQGETWQIFGNWTIGKFVLAIGLKSHKLSSEFNSWRFLFATLVFLANKIRVALYIARICRKNVSSCRIACTRARSLLTDEASRPKPTVEVDYNTTVANVWGCKYSVKNTESMVRYDLD